VEAGLLKYRSTVHRSRRVFVSGVNDSGRKSDERIFLFEKASL
jgi:hypothetical protein